jgi:hypothetical protein
MRSSADQLAARQLASLYCMGQTWKIVNMRVANRTKIASSAKNFGTDCLASVVMCAPKVDQAGRGCVMLHLKLRGRAAGLF